MSIDYTYTDASPEPEKRDIAPGDYSCTVAGYAFGMTTSGNDKLDLTLRLEEVDAELVDAIYFTPRSQWKFDLVLKCFASSKGLTLPGKDAALTINDTFVDNYLMGGKGKITVFKDSWVGSDGQTRQTSKVKSYHPDSTLITPTSDTRGSKGQTNMLQEDDDNSNTPF